LKARKKRTSHGTQTLYRSPTDYKTNKNHKPSSNGTSDSKGEDSDEEITQEKKKVAIPQEDILTGESSDDSYIFHQTPPNASLEEK